MDKTQSLFGDQEAVCGIFVAFLYLVPRYRYAKGLSVRSRRLGTSCLSIVVVTLHSSHSVLLLITATLKLCIQRLTEDDQEVWKWLVASSTFFLHSKFIVRYPFDMSVPFYLHCLHVLQCDFHS